MLRANLRDLRTEAGEHYADILLSLYQRQLKELREEQEVDRAAAEAVRDAAAAAEVGRQANRSEVGGAESSARACTLNPGADRGNGQVDRPGEAQRTNGSGDASVQNGTGRVGQVDKSTLPISAPRRIRDKDHLRYVASQPCLVCGRAPSHAHHIRFAQPRALGRKVSDEWTVPLCATHHRSLHAVGDEQRWWKERQIDPIPHAERFWRSDRGDVSQAVSRARELILPTPS
jgi:hypothetical protein